MVEKQIESHSKDFRDMVENSGLKAFNSALSQQGEVGIGLNREKLAELLFNQFNVWDDSELNKWENVKKSYYIYLYWLGKADAIIADEGDLLEVKI